MFEGEGFGVLASRTGERGQQDNSALVFVVSRSVEKLCSTIRLKLQLQGAAVKRDHGNIAYAHIVHSPMVGPSLTGERTRCIFPSQL